jgi:hypothetical protein
LGLAVKIGIIGFGILVVAAGYEAYQTRITPPEVLEAQTLVSRDLANTVIAAFPSSPRWTSLAIDDVTPNAYRFTLLYPPGAATAAEIAADAKDVAQEMRLRLALSGHHPNDERTVIVVAARETARDGAPGPRLGEASFDAARDRIAFTPAEP